MILYLVIEDNHGEIAITETFKKAIDFLYTDEWIIESDLNRDATDNMTLEEFNAYFDDMIRIKKIKFEKGIARLR